VTVRDDWLMANYAGIPVNEDQLTPAHVGGAGMYGASIGCTVGVYAAELQAIARTLAMFALSATLHIHADSLGALTGIRAYESSCNERKRLRMPARTLLQLIHSLLQRRKQAGGAVHWLHVKAHTHNADIDSVGNRLSDYQANCARKRPLQPMPLSLRQLPLDECEYRMTVTQPDGYIHSHRRRAPSSSHTAAHRCHQALGRQARRTLHARRLPGRPGNAGTW